MNMPQNIVNLLRSNLRVAKRFKNITYRDYFHRWAKENARLCVTLNDKPVEQERIFKEMEKNFEILSRQVVIDNMYYEPNILVLK